MKDQPEDGHQALSIHHLLEIQAQRKPDAIAIRGVNRSALSFRRLLLQAQDTVKSLNVLGIGRNNRVAVVLPNGPEIAVACMAVACGATCAPLNPACRADEFDFYLADLEAKALIVEAGTDSPARAVARQRSIPIIELSPATENAALFTLTCGNRRVAFQDGFSQREDVALILYTSGTTSRPKMVPLSHSNLLTSATNIAAALELTDTDRCLNVMPLFHIHGLIGAILSSLVAGSSVICTPEFSAPQFLDRLEEFHPTWYTAVPTMHQAIVARVKENHRTIGRSSLRLIRSSSAPLPLKVMTDLEALFNAPVIEAYGMTEASHQIASNPLPPHQRKAGSVGIATGTEIAVMGESGNLLPSGETGEIVIRGGNLTRGYENDSAANQSAFVHGWFRTGDLGYLDQDGYLFITGRLKEIINRGGEKVSPAEVDHVLMDHPAVAQVATFAMPHSKLGEEVAAAVVLRKNASATEREIQEFAALRLAEYKVPRRVVFVGEIPKSATGKLQRVGLAEKLGLTTYEPTDGGNPKFVAPRTLVEEILAKIWSQVLRLEPVGVHDNFFDLGGDSLLAAQVISRLRESLQTELSFLDFFEAPTVAGMAAGIRTVSRDGRALTIPPIGPAPRDSQLPLSFAQQRLWFFDQLEPGSPAYNRPAFLRLSGRLDTEALQRSLNEIVRRHEVLRTTFSAVDGRPYQVISPALERAMPIVDLSQWPHAERETEARRLAIEEDQRPFDLTSDPLLRARLLRLGDDEHILVLTTHHIAFDGWSDGILFKELAEIYEAFSRGQLSPLAELSIQYADYAAWQQQWVQEEVLDAQLAYWRSQLAGAPPTLELPTDRRRPAIETFQGARQSVLLPKPLSDALKALGRRECATLFMTLLAAFKVFLCRYTGQDDVVVGAPVAGRNRVETEKLIGVFINTLVLRTDLSGNPSFRELLSRVRQISLEAYAHQDLPFEKLVEDLQPERDLSRNPLFQVMFQLRNMPVEAVQLSGVKVEELNFAGDVAKLDLIVEFVEKAEGLACLLTYNIDLFDAVTVTRMAGHFQTLLQSLVADPDQRISQLTLLPEPERHTLLLEWNGTRRDWPKDTCIHQLFEAQVERTPDAAAVLFPSRGLERLEERHLTYRELNRRANQLAHYLKRLGVGPEVTVGLCVERSPHMIVGLLAILKAGGAYLPLDPAYPKERLEFMLNDAGANVLLTQRTVFERLLGASIQNPKALLRILEGSKIQNRTVLCLDSEWTMISQESEQTPAIGATASNLAYVIYTSGSSGKPKGVEITHRALTNVSLSAAAAFELQPADRILQFASIGFDTAAEEIFPCLIRGATLVLRADSMLDSVSSFLRQWDESRISVLDLPTAYWHELTAKLASEQLSLPAQVRLVIIGGERAAPERVALWQETVGSRVRLLNTYGPTEGTVVSTHCELTGSDGKLASLREVPIGRPIANVQTYGLDRNLNPVPVGVSGELHIAGAGLARAYVNSPELTAEQFIPNPFSEEPGSRLYKTGDLARYLPDGSIEFLGRIDNQVKIRGYRIELGEIESMLAQHPAVREAVVSATDEASDNSPAPVGTAKRLAAYIVLNREQIQTIDQLEETGTDVEPKKPNDGSGIFEESYPLSPMQEGMIFHSLYAPESGVDIEQIIFRLDEKLDVPAFDRAWQRVVERHSALRTSFYLDAHGKLSQRVRKHVHLGLKEQDWRGLSVEEKEERLKTYLKADRKRGFDLLEAPLIRLALFRVAEADYQFLWTFHHALLDGRAISLVLKEGFGYYEAFCEGRNPLLEEPRPYREYIDWLQGLDWSRSESFWRGVLKGFTAPTPLPVHAQKGMPVPVEGYAEQATRLAEGLTSALQSLAQQHQLTLNTLVQGAWSILLSRYSGKEDIVFGATRACRQSTVDNTESIVGVFINTLPVRVNVSPEMSLLPWLKELRARQIAVRDHEHTPLVKLQRWSDVRRGMPLFESILVFENYEHNAALRAQGGGWANREFRLLEQTNYPLTLSGYAGPELLLEIAYDRRRFDDETIARMLGHLQILLEGMAANPEQRLSDLPLLSDAGRHQLSVEPAGKGLAPFVSERQRRLTADELRSFLKQKLPDYMIPAVFIFLDALPLTANGKLDCKALPTATPDRPELEQGFAAPRTPVEETLAAIWSKVLKVEHIGIHDNFFDLGGHSLLATQVISRLHDAFCIDLPLRSLFENPTVAGLAAHVASIVVTQGPQAAPYAMVGEREEIEL